MAEDERLPDAPESTANIAASTDVSSATTKKKRKKKKPKNHVLSEFMVRNPPWAYLHLRQTGSIGKATASLDAVTAHLQITAALTQFLGMHGSAVPVDILKVEDADVWIRLPNDDKAALIAALGSWVSSKAESWRVMGSSSWDARAMASDGGQDLFND